MSNKAELSGSEDDFEMDQDNIDEGASPELLEAVATLKSALHDNPNQYEQHTQLITLLKSADMLEELRAAREAMNAVFPLSEDLWLEWIEDESNMAASEEEKKHILELYRRATSEYLSIKIWKSYVDYATQEFVESVDLPESEIVVSKDDMRRIFKDADKYTGHHIPESHTIWNCWRDFELQLIAAQTPASPEDVKRVKTMYLERIAIPHADQENTFSSLSSFISQHDNADYENTMVQSNKIMSNTRKLLSERERFEQDLVSTSNGLEAFMSYLEFESNPARRLFARLRTLFERAVSVHCLVPAVWNDYASFLMSSNPRNKQYDLNPSEVLSIAGKAVRNCPWSGDLWENRFLLMEIHMRSEDEVNDGHNKIREAFKHALTVMDAAGGDPYCRLERFWIELEANVLGDHEKARKLWIDIESKQKTLSDYWITQADMERGLQNLKGARQIFVRACNVAKHLDWPEKIFETWLMFERQNGSVTDYKEAVVRSRNAMKAVETLRAQAALQAESIYSEQMAYSSTSTAAAATEPAQAPPSSSMEAMPETTNKRRLSAQDDQQASKAAKTGDSAADQTSQRIRNQKRPLDISTGRHEDTCFVTNFPDTMTEAKLRELFAEFGTILRCTIPQRPGTKRNFGYVQFSSSEEAHAALALDGRDVGEQRGLCVNISDTGKAKRTKGGKAPLPKVSRHELHVSGFTNEMKEDELQKLVELHATPVEVFIKRQARSKGPAWANIKFETEEEANAALALDGTMFHGKPLNVKRREFQNSHWEKDEQHSGSSKGHRGNQAADAKEKGGKSQRSQQHKDRQERAKSDGQEQVGTDAETTGGGLAVGSTSAAEESSTQIKGSNDGTLDSAATDSVNEDKKAQGSFASETQDRATTAAPRKPMAKLTSMQPRVLQPRQAPKRAFKQVSLRTANPVGSSASTTSTSGEGSGEGPSTAAPAAPAAAPKSNAEFRALMLSGALKKKQT
ncbi:Squamous cell carcinoma antigen recognized by T-cells 3 [Mortierella alpina]|nr:Squamous cell carcinoma antigen recognized by T-cells 3 [Mortierella alpina]